MELRYEEGKLTICGTPHHYNRENSELGHLYFVVELPEKTKLKLFNALKAELFPTVLIGGVQRELSDEEIEEITSPASTPAPVCTLPNKPLVPYPGWTTCPTEGAFDTIAKTGLLKI